MLFYCVTTTFDDRGRVTANITETRECDTKPPEAFRITTRRDIYCDWFDTLEEAMAFVDEARAC